MGEYRVGSWGLAADGGMVGLGKVVWWLGGTGV
jgi:hypothetical protein